jgi:hypothetical protein
MSARSREDARPPLRHRFRVAMGDADAAQAIFRSTHALGGTHGTETAKH